MIHLITMKFSQKPSWRASPMRDLIDCPLIQPHSWNLVGISNVIRHCWSSSFHRPVTCLGFVLHDGSGCFMGIGEGAAYGQLRGPGAYLLYS